MATASSGLSSSYGAITTDSSGRTKMASLIAGVDVNALVDEMVQAKEKIAETYQDKVTLNTDKKIPEIENLRTKAITIQSTLNYLTNTYSVDQTIPNAFAEKVINPKQDDNSINVTISRRTNTTLSDYTINVIQTAKADKITSKSFSSITDTLNFNDGESLVINGQTISLNSSSTLQGICEAINLTTNTTNVSASLLKISDTQGYKLIIESTQIATPIDFTGTSPSQSGDNGLGMPEVNSSLDQLSAKISLNGITLTRTSNTITDAIPNATIDLIKPSTQDTIFSIEPDKSFVSKKIQEFVTNYNDLVDFIQKNEKQKEDGTPADAAILYGESILEDVKSMLRRCANGLAAGISSANGDYTTLFDIGIRLNKLDSSGGSSAVSIDGKMYIDNTKFSKAINSDFDKVKKLFGSYAAVSDSDHFTTWKMPTTLNSAIVGKEITITYTKSDENNYTAVLSTAGQSDITIPNITNSLIEGPTGSIYEGLILGYTGASLSVGNSATTTVTLSQGIGVEFFKTLSNATQKRTVVTDPPKGLFDRQVEILLKDNKYNNDIIKDIKTNAEEIRKNFEPKLQRLYEISSQAASIEHMLEVQLAMLKSM